MKKNQDEELVSAIFSLSRIIRERIGIAHNRDSLSFLQVKTLGIVAERGNPSMKEIADCLHILSPSATDIINRLVKNKELLREKDPNDRRVVRLSLTPKGRATFETELARVKNILVKIIAKLSSDEKKHFMSILTKIISTNQS